MFNKKKSMNKLQSNFRTSITYFTDNGYNLLIMIWTLVEFFILTLLNKIDIAVINNHLYNRYNMQQHNK